MDSFKSLLERKEYALVLNLSEGSKDPETLFCRLSALLATNDAQGALALFLENREALYVYNPLLTLKSNFELRFINGQFDEAYADEPYFENKPYVSQEVEEYLRGLPKLIRLNERNSRLAAAHSPEDVDRILRGPSEDFEVLSLLDSLRDMPLAPYIDALKTLLLSSRHPAVKTYGLLLLVSAQYPGTVAFTKNGKRYDLVPKNLVPPYTGPLFQGFLAYLRSLSNDPSLQNVALSLLNDYILNRYPEPVISKAEDPGLALALLSLAKRYLRSDVDLESTRMKLAIPSAAVEEESALIANALTTEKPLKM